MKQGYGGKIYKEYIHFAAIFLSISILICGCGKKEQSTHNNSALNTSPKETEIKLHWYFPGVGRQEDTELVENEIYKYLKDKINTSVKLHCYDWESYPEKMKSMIAAGEEFDICFTASWGLNYREQAAKGAFIPLDDLLDKYAPQTKALLGEHFLTGSKVKGKNYALPTNKEKAQQYGFLFLKRIVDKYDIDVNNIKQPQDLEPILKLVKEREENIYPLSGGFIALLKGYFDDMGAPGPGVIRHNSQGLKVILQEETQESMEYYRLAHKFFNAGYIRKDSAININSVADEKAGKVFAKCISLKPMKDREFSIATGQKWVQVTLTEKIITNFDTIGSMQAISRTCKNPERAMMFLEVVNTDRYLNNLINFGIENKHYHKVSDNIIKKGDDNAKYNPGYPFIYGNVFLNYIWDSEDPNKWDIFEAYNKGAMPSKSLGFSFDPTPVKNEIMACNAVNKDYESGLETGTLDPEIYLPKYIKALKEAGAEKIIEEKQRQIDIWSQNK